jgi:hypothetical protein
MLKLNGLNQIYVGPNAINLLHDNVNAIKNNK